MLKKLLKINKGVVMELDKADLYDNEENMINFIFNLRFKIEDLEDEVEGLEDEVEGLKKGLKELTSKVKALWK